MSPAPAPGFQVRGSGNFTRAHWGCRRQELLDSHSHLPFSMEPKGGPDCSGWQGYFFNFNLPLRSDPYTVASGLYMMVLVPASSPH